jgi:hypothetical protein
MAAADGPEDEDEAEDDERLPLLPPPCAWRTYFFSAPKSRAKSSTKTFGEEYIDRLIGR